MLAEQKISPLKAVKIRNFLNGFMAKERDSSAKADIISGCRIAVLIPAYNETPETLLRPLLSLARQKGVDYQIFEVVLIVNNSKREALEKSEVFFVNKRVLDFIGFINGAKSTREEWSIDLLEKAREITDSRLSIRVIDKASPEFAEAENHVAHARNRGCLEIAWRFLRNNAGWDGIIAMTDADCRLAPNYIATILEIFRRYAFLNGLAGSREHEIDPGIPYAGMVKKAFEQHIGHALRFSAADTRPNRDIVFQRRDGFARPLLNCGQDMVFPARSWLLTGGIPNTPSGEDYKFGNLLAALPGEIAVTNRYTVFPLIRLSERTGIGGYGRRVKKIAASVADYMEGKHSRVFVPDLNKQKELIGCLLKQARDFGLTPQNIRSLMEQFDCRKGKFNLQDLANLAQALTEETKLRPTDMDYVKLDSLLMKGIYHMMPERDVTVLVV